MAIALDEICDNDFHYPKSSLTNPLSMAPADSLLPSPAVSVQAIASDAPSADSSADPPVNPSATTARLSLPQRPRRLRSCDGLRRMVRETRLSTNDLIYPVFVMTGENQCVEVASMPGCYRFSLDRLLDELAQVQSLGIPGIALFPLIPDAQKDAMGSECYNPEGLVQQSIRTIKAQFPDLILFTDIALDPYSSQGHDGLVAEDGRILNDETVEILVRQAISQAEAGTDFVAPSDMMDGRIGAIRRGLDAAGYPQVGILAYSAKYASAYYGPFRDALDSAPRFGDKKTYQMDPANGNEALREIALDIAEGADMVMVKPALAYLDIIWRVKQASHLPVAAYNVSGEYALIKAAVQQGWIDEKAIVLETLTSMKRAGADVILSYFAKDVAQWLKAGF